MPLFFKPELSNISLYCRTGCKRYCGLCPGFPVGTTPETASSGSPATPSSSTTPSPGYPEASPVTPTYPGFPVAASPTTPPGGSPSDSTGTFACVDVAPPDSPYNCAQQVCKVCQYILVQLYQCHQRTAAQHGKVHYVPVVAAYHAFCSRMLQSHLHGQALMQIDFCVLSYI